MKNKILAGIASAGSFLGIASLAHADTIEQVVTNGVASTTGSVTTTLTTSLPYIFVVFGGLIALGLAIRYIYKLIGRK